MMINEKLKTFLLYLCLISTMVLFFICKHYDAKISDLELAHEAVNTANDVLTVTNDYLQERYESLVGKKEGYDCFGYWVDIPDNQSIHVLVNYHKDYLLNPYQQMLLEEHHKNGLKEIEMEDWNKELE